MTTLRDVYQIDLHVGELICEIGYQDHATPLPFKIVTVEFGEVHLAKHSPGVSQRKASPFEVQPKIYGDDWEFHHAVTVEHLTAKCVRWSDLAKYNNEQKASRI